ncbi:MAG TPA: glycosyltransferase [Janthinobacterium sp.]|nr:glycosyltransferase [Janthinobacterium sp.]
MIAYHYPPMQGSSGIQRALRFSQHLPDYGWEVSVLSVHPRAYQCSSGDQMADIGAGVTVRRSFALDTSRHLAWRGRYPGWLALPDRWISWWLSAVPAGLALIRRQRPDVIWSTYPIATAHLIALSLHRISGIPWVADQRDPMSDSDYPAEPRARRLHEWIEDKIVRHSACMVCTTPGAQATYRARYPETDGARFRLIENGYDEGNFAAAEASPPAPRPAGAAFRLLHSGIVYPSERDPTALFTALARLRQDGALGPATFRLVLRATGNDDYLRAMLERDAIADLVELAPALPYRAALVEMLAADGLLLLQAANCNAQIPAKLYEYLRAGKPILALTDPAGDSAAKLRACGIDTIARLDSAADIAHGLKRFLTLSGQARAPLAGAATVALQSRLARSVELARLFDHVIHQEET